MPFELREPVDPERRPAFAERLRGLAEAAAAGTDLPDLAARAAEAGLRPQDLAPLKARCDELTRPLTKELESARPGHQKTFTSLAAFFHYGNVGFPAAFAEPIYDVVLAGAGTSVALVTGSLMPGVFAEEETLEAALVVGKVTPAQWRRAVAAAWRNPDPDELDEDPWDSVDLYTARYRAWAELGIEMDDEPRRRIARDLGRVIARSSMEQGRRLGNVTRSPRLLADIRDATRAARYFLLDGQEADGSWSYPYDPPGVAIRETAEASIALSILGEDDAHLAAAARGAEWLMTQRASSGAWLGKYEEVRESPLLTARALEAVLRATGNTPSAAIAESVDWLWRQQDPVGLWGRTHTAFGGVGQYGTTARIFEALDFYNRSLAAAAGPDAPPNLEAAAEDVTARDNLYEEILSHLRSAARDMEQSPSAYRGQDEEARRHLIRFRLNGPFRGLFSAETENAAGRTDLLLRHAGRNLFIAECKFWSGTKGFTATLDQLLGYAGWLDDKLAILLFVKEKRPGQVVARARAALEGHPAMLALLDSPQGELRARVRLQAGSEADLHVLVIHVQP